MSTQTLRPASDTIDAARALLGQLRDLVGALDDTKYTAPCDAMHNACIGAHVRHALDHYRAALSGLEGDTIDYDHRARKTDVETSTAGALREIAALSDAIGAIDPGRVGDGVTIRVMLTGDGACTELDTTLARELAFATHHAVHHNAMIKTIASEQGAQTPDAFGKAPSTIDHERNA